MADSEELCCIGKWRKKNKLSLLSILPSLSETQYTNEAVTKDPFIIGKKTTACADEVIVPIIVQCL